MTKTPSHLPSKIAPFCRMVVLFICVFFVSNQALGQTKKVVNKYPSGQLMEKGKLVNGQKTGIWQYYHPLGWLERKEKLKDGKVLWAILYDEKQNKIRWIDENGIERDYKNCRCKN